MLACIGWLHAVYDEQHDLFSGPRLYLLQVSKRFYELMQLFNEQPSDPSENDSDIESDGSPIG